MDASVPERAGVGWVTEMRPSRLALGAVALLVACTGPSSGSGVAAQMPEQSPPRVTTLSDLGDRPRHLIELMRDGPLKKRLEGCAALPLRRTRFSIGHRGAARGFPEHTRESYEAAARMGAGVIECDVTFTKDRKLVCRHSQCDLQATTNILAVPALAAKCAAPFTPADPATGKDASAKCCTSDVTLAEFESLCGKMDGVDWRATSVADYIKGAPGAAAPSPVACGKVMSHAESIALIDGLGRAFTPELKTPSVAMPFEGDYTLERYAEQLVAEYRDARIDPSRVFVQSTSRAVLAYLREHAPDLARNAVYLDEEVGGARYDAAVAELPRLAAEGIHIVAPPMWALLTLDAQERIVPSRYALAAKASGLDLVTFTFERAGSLEHGDSEDYRSVASAVTGEGDAYVLLDVLARQVGLRGIFSDWPATVTYYADCMGL